jgi:hypothetical protein
MAWNLSSIYYFDKDKDPLILDCLLPLAARLREVGARRMFFDRHWLGGPHLRLYVESDGDGIAPIVDAEVARYLGEHPSTAALDETETKARHERLALLEQQERALPLQPNNSIRHESYAPNLRVLRSEAAANLTFDVADAALPLVFDVVAASRSDRNRRQIIALRLLLAHAHHLGGIENGYLFCRSYFEKYLATQTSDPAVARAGFRRVYEARREPLRELVISMKDDLERTEGAGSDPVVSGWTRLHRLLRHRTREILAAGAELVWTPDAAALDVYDATWTSQFFNHKTDYMERLTGNQSLRHSLNTDPRYKTHVFAVNQLYRLLGAVGITAGDKILLMALIADSVEETFGVSPLELISRDTSR